MSPSHLTTIQRITDLVCSRRNVTPSDLEGPSHAPEIVWARYLALALSHRLTPLSNAELGSLFNRRPNSVGIALRTFATWCDCYPQREREAQSLVAEFQRLWVPPSVPSVLTLT
jgi:hypothetical protein